jgi:hypothetical protein
MLYFEARIHKGTPIIFTDILQNGANKKYFDEKYAFAFYHDALCDGAG